MVKIKGRDHAMTAEQVLAAHGIQRPAEVVELAAAAAGLDLAAAATLLQKESGGGQNVFGHDPVNTGGFYVKGAEVTEDAYKNYKAHRAQLGCQGVGPTLFVAAASSTVGRPGSRNIRGIPVFQPESGIPRMSGVLSGQRLNPCGSRSSRKRMTRRPGRCSPTAGIPSRSLAGWICSG